MSRTWPLEEAQERFPEVIELAERGEAQVVTRGEEEAVVVLAYDEYKRLTGEKKSLWDALMNGPRLEDEELERVLARDHSVPRKVDLDLAP